MNKDVIYIEDKIVALVPPKKAGVFRSVVNIKLIAKAGKTAEKSVVLVTVDPSITKLAATTKLPVAKNLETAPKIPVAEPELESTSKEEVEEPSKDEPDDEVEWAEDEEASKKEEAEEEPEDEEDETEEEPAEKPAQKDKKPKKVGKNKFISWIINHKKSTIAICIVILAAIAFLVWAFGVAPAVDVTVSIKADSKPFSESISFVDKLSDEKSDEGKFYLEEKKIELCKEYYMGI